MNKRGQITIPNVIMMIVTIVVFVAMLPLLTTTISNGVGNLSEYPMSIFAITLIPLIFILSIIVGIIGVGRYYNDQRY